MSIVKGFPQKQGLYDPALEKDACGVGFIADVTGEKSHEIIKKGLEILKNLSHRGATGSDPETGDGAGILMQIPHEFLVAELAKEGIKLPRLGDYGVGMVFLPMEPHARYFCEGVFERIIREEGLSFLAWREVPVDDKACGVSARGTRPMVQQVFIARGGQDPELFARKLYIVRKRVENAIYQAAKPYTEAFYVCSLSAQTVVYKGQFLAHQIERFYPELTDRRLTSAMVTVHQRYSTNTFPSWRLAHPYRFLAHNGEINTIRGNIKWVQARESELTSALFGPEFSKVLPIIQPGGSDSCSLDNIFELLVLNGYTMPHAIKMLIPEAWRYYKSMPAELRAFYEYHEGLIEPWDGPATIVFCDGERVGAALDRNGLRPARFLITRDNLVVLASEAGVLDIPEDRILKKGKLGPGEIILVDTREKRIISDPEIKKQLSREKVYAQWIRENEIDLDKISQERDLPHLDEETLITKQVIFGYTEEELRRIIAPMAGSSHEAIGSMGNDAPLAVLSNKPQLLFNYFRQLFAQVTNPPIDSLREKKVMSLNQYLGRNGNILQRINEKEPNKFVELEQPILYPELMEKIKSLNAENLRHITIPILFEADQYAKGLTYALNALEKRVEESIIQGYRIIILSDRDTDRYHAPIPSLLAVSAVHNYLIKKKLRTKADLIIETGEARDTFHMALLLGFGATAVYPFLAYETINYLLKKGLYLKGISLLEAYKNYGRSLNYGLRKITAKMGISTLRSFNGAQIFEVVGLDEALVEKYFSGTPCRLSGMKMDGIAKETLMRHRKAFAIGVNSQRLDMGGDIHYRKNEENHLFNPDTISKLQHACRTGNYSLFKEYSQLINDQSNNLMTIRGLLKFKNLSPLPIDEVEPVESIMKRFATGAMSFGSISQEAHEILAIAMNSIGGKSNSGEGGEDETRYNKVAGGVSTSSAIKQVAAARFGVTANYLIHADELQIKMAQGAKPGEGGHLPGEKVTEEIGRVRHSLPGIDLISPPPHHDIYSIEDLEQLIYDLKNINPAARVSVKLVAEAGVGTVAAGVAKGNADVVLISGHDGGTGASPISSIKTAGLPWELGLAETQQTLLLNNLRSRITVQVDGQMRTGRDVVIGALLGAEEFGFATVALVVCGCIMMRKCHNNTCPVGIATQDPELRKNFQGKPEHVINFFRFIAMEVREIMAELGVRTFDEMVGRVDLLEVDESKRHWKTRELDLSTILYRPELPARFAQRKTEGQSNKAISPLAEKLVEIARPAVEKGVEVQAQFQVKNTDRTVGTLLAGVVTKHWGSKGLPEDTIDFTFFGTAGQSFGAFAVPGVTLRLYGEANDYVGKGLSGGKIIIAPHPSSPLIPDENIIAGNTLLYGATSGAAYISGRAGERFAVRNSGALAVVEGVGEHGCEYMTGGRVVILGSTGRNFGAGMSGGIAYIYDEDDDFSTKCNFEMVEIEPLKEWDVDFLKSALERHVQYTGSPKGKRILEDFQRSLAKFIRVISPQYRQIIEKTGEKDICRTVKFTAKEPGFKKYRRKSAAKVPVPERLKNYKSIYIPQPESDIMVQASRCMDCGVAYCNNACPLGNILPELNYLVTEGQWKKALDVLHHTNNFPEFTGRLCPALCEAACALGINQEPAINREIELSIIEKGFQEGWVRPLPPVMHSGYRVAVIGSGPAGLAAAQQLVRSGHQVTVFERAGQIGGILALGIPDYKLEKWVIERRVDQMRQEGVVFKTNTNVGIDISPEALKAKFDAVCLAMGSTVPRDLDVAGRSLAGIHFAMEYLRQQNLINQGMEIPEADRINAKGKNVVIIGGGDTGADCLGVALRQGAKQVYQFELLPKPPLSRTEKMPWPTWPMILRTNTSHEEGGERRWSIGTKYFSGEKGRVAKIHCVELDWAQEGGQIRMAEIPGSEFSLDVDLVLFAMGFLHPEHGALLDKFGVAVDEKGNVKTNEGYQTNIPGVFAAGDMRTGQSLVCKAIADGRGAARAISAYLERQ